MNVTGESKPLQSIATDKYEAMCCRSASRKSWDICSCHNKISDPIIWITATNSRAHDTVRAGSGRERVLTIFKGIFETDGGFNAT